MDKNKMEALKVVNLKNEAVGEVDLSESVFQYPLKRHLIYEAVNAYRAAGRSGTRQTKTRAEVSGSGRKLWRQKKTGRARVGSIRSSIWRKGGTVFGPHPFDYDIRFPKRMRKNAIRSVLSSRLRQNKVLVVESLELEAPRTRDMVEILKTLGIKGKVLLVDREPGRNLELASRNLRGVHVASVGSLNVVDLLDHDTLVLSRDAALSIGEVYAP
jgi:large subunit ribosomal protein L4